MTEPERLSRELRNRAGETGGHPISLDDVKRSANKMKWQQRAAVGGVAAVALAIALPVGLSFAGSDKGAKPPVATQSPSPSLTGTPSPTPTPTGVKKVALAVNQEGTGGELQIASVTGRELNQTTGDVINLDVRLRSFAPLGDGYIGLGYDDQGDWYVYHLDATGKVTRQAPSGGYSLAVSPDGSQVAYSTADGKIFVAWDGGERELDTNAANQVDVVGIQGSGACVDPETEAGNGCTVFWNADSKAMLSSSHGIVDQIPGLTKVVGVSADGNVAGFVSASDTGSCSAVVSPQGKQLWKTCDYSLGKFSPDGKQILGRPAYLDGVGDGLLAILDAKTGDPVIQYDAVDQAIISDTVWEAGNSLVTLVYGTQGGAVMRPGADGEVLRGFESIPGSAEEPALVFATQP